MSWQDMNRQFRALEDQCGDIKKEWNNKFRFVSPVVVNRESWEIEVWPHLPAGEHLEVSIYLRRGGCSWGGLHMPIELLGLLPQVVDTLKERMNLGNNEGRID